MNHKKVDARLKEMETTRANIDADLLKITKNLEAATRAIGDFGNRWGTFTEGLVMPSLYKILYDEFGIDDISERKKKRLAGNQHIELDVFGCVNSTINTAIIVEIKSHLRDDGIEQLMEHIEQFPLFFPEHRDKKLYGMIACVSAPDNLRNILRKKGIYLVMMGQEAAELTRPDKFVAKNYNP